jgi:hypothetical protein
VIKKFLQKINYRFAMPYLFLADIIAIIHLGYVIYVILGFILIVVGIIETFPFVSLTCWLLLGLLVRHYWG